MPGHTVCPCPYQHSCCCFSIRNQGGKSSQEQESTSLTSLLYWRLSQPPPVLYQTSAPPFIKPFTLTIIPQSVLLGHPSPPSQVTCHLPVTLGSTLLTPSFPRALPISVLPTHHTCDCPHTGLFLLAHHRHLILPLSQGLAHLPEMVLPGAPLHLHLSPWQERGRRRQAKPLLVEWACLIWCLFSVPSAQSLLNGVHL